MATAVPSASVPIPTGWRRIAPVVAAAVVAILVYSVTLRGTYVYDDVTVVVKDPRLTNPSLWHEYWTQPYMAAPDKLYRPLVSLSFALQRVLGGENPWPFHLVNILLHAAVAAAVAELGIRLAGIRVAWIAGLLFAVHPVHVEAVAGLVGRCESACALATLCGLCAFLGRPMNRWRVAFISICCAAALLSKEQGMLFPLLLLALLPLSLARGIAPPERAAMKILAACVCYITAAYVLLREYTVGFWWDRTFLEWVMNPLVRSQGIDRVLMPVELVGRYFVVLVAPHRQAVDYGGMAIGWRVNWHDPYLYLGALTMAAWTIACVKSFRRRNWALAFCLLALAITYAMVGNIVALIGTIFAERLIYLPSAFFLLIVALGLARLPRTVLVPMTVAIVVAGSMAAFAYARLWNTPLALFERCVENQPGGGRNYDLLFHELARRAQWADARRVAEQAIIAVPESDRPYGMLIEVQLKMGQPQEAWQTYLRGMGACKGFEKLYLLGFGGEIAQQLATRPSDR
jgi:hypothetical protein